MAKQKRKRGIPKIMSRKARGRATSRLLRMNGVFKKATQKVGNSHLKAISLSEPTAYS